jgi:peptidyl-prolyl cis-trans isomerase C
MSKSWLLCVLLGTLAWGQAAAPPPSPTPLANPMQAQTPAAPADTSASVPPNAPVITVKGVCEPQPKTAVAKDTAAKPAAKTSAAANSSADCKTVITKAQFETLANNLAPNISPQMKKQLAGVLPRLIAMSNAAKKQGLENTPQFKERVKFNRMQILAQQLQQSMQDDAAKVPDADIEKYYKEHQDAFEQYNVDRIFVPRTKQGSEAEAKEENEKDEKLTEEQQKAKQEAEKTKADEAEQAMTKLAGELQKRAAAGEDFAKLQKEAFEATGMKIESPTVNLPNVRRTGLPAGHTAVFDLKPGDISTVISDAGGHYIYKLNSKTPVSLDQAKNEIHSKLQNDRMREKTEKLNSSFQVETNEAYFGPAGAGPMMPRPSRPRPGVPPGMPSIQPQTPPPAQPPAANPN